MIIPRHRSIFEALEGRILLSRPLGIDTSHYDTAVDWTQVKAAGISFAWTKVTEGTSYLDPTASTFLPAAKAAGVYIGGYDFARYDEDSAASEVSWFLSKASPYIKAGYMVPMLDVEHTTTLTKAQVSAWVDAWCQGIYSATGVIPVIYVGPSFAGTYFDSTVAQWPVWFAEWPSSPNPQTGAPSPTTPWSTWNFWQYAGAGNGQGLIHVPGVGGTGQDNGVDADVYNGTLAQLAAQFVIGPPTTPANPSPSTGATGISRSGLTLNWDDSFFATSYDVYLDNLTTPVANVTSSQWTISPQTVGGTHQWKIVAQGSFGTTAGPIWSFTVNSLPAPATPGNASPPNHALISVKPITLSWAPSANATSYDLYAGGVFYANVTTTSFGPISPIDGAHTWQIVAKNADASTTGPTWTFTIDTVAPTGTLSANQSPASGSSTFDFTVAYADATSGLNAATFDSSDITVTGPNGFDQDATFVSATGNLVTYAITAPGGSWNLADNGAYTVAVNANEVKDKAGNAVAAGSVGAFSASGDYAYLAGDTLHIGYLPAASSVTVSTDGSGNTLLDEDGNQLSFATTSFSNVLIDGTAGDNSVTLNNSLGMPLAFNGGAGNDTLTLGPGVSQSFDTDVSAMSANLNLIVDSTATATFNTAQHLASLTINGSASAAAGGSNTLVTKSLAISGGNLDLNDNSLIVDYDTNSPIGTWNGSAYDGLTGMIASGRDGGLWDGNGLRSSNAGDSHGLTALGIGEAADVLHLASGQTGTFAGQSVDDTAVLIKYTYAGDANLDGRVNGDDYFAIDGHVNQNGSVFGWASGDFNLDGHLNGDDYFIIDSNINTQGPPL